MGKNKLLMVFLLMLMFFGSIAPVMAQKPFTQGSYYERVVEPISLYVDGSITPVMKNITKDYDHITALTIHIVFETTSLDWDDFGEGNGVGSLANGTIGYFGDVLSPFVITTNERLMGVSSEAWVYEDGQVTKGYHLKVMIDFTDYVPNIGLTVQENGGSPYVRFLVRDNIPLYCDNFFVIVKGNKWIDQDIEVRYDFLEEISDMDEILDLPLFAIFFPLALILSGDPIIAIVGFVIGVVYVGILVEFVIIIVKKF